MEARSLRAALLAVALFIASGASYRTTNFVVQTSDPRLAQQFGDAAEKYRKELAVSWLGQELPKWSAPCPITVQVGNVGAGGETSFVFDRGEVFGWRMSIQGSAQRVLDSVLPHEITHMVFASHFRQPLPRWADEGGASSVEHLEERSKHQQMLQTFLRTGRGIAFNQMFAMTEYPRDVMPLYAQGYTVAEYLIQMHGRRTYVDYIGEGMRTKNWSAATKHYYGIEDLGVLQTTWLAWVAKGYPDVVSTSTPPTAVAVAAAGPRPRPEPNLIYRMRPTEATPEGAVVPAGAVLGDRDTAVVAATNRATLEPAADGWRGVPDSPEATSETPAAVRTQVTHPQPVQSPQQTVLDWGDR